jgi:SAM-dependent methyltransferase
MPVGGARYALLVQPCHVVGSVMANVSTRPSVSDGNGIVSYEANGLGGSVTLPSCAHFDTVLCVNVNLGYMTTDGWREVNLANWESRVPLHTGPGGYDLDAFDDPDHLSGVVRYDLPRLGRLDGLDVVHLQCHIGTDTVSLARLGARSLTGLDFSPAALTAARALAERAKANVTFVESDLYDAVDTVGPARFDVVYTGIGAICWLPDIVRWARVVADLLRPGGRLFLREGHPVLWSVSDPRPDGLLVIEFPYFETDGVSFSEPVTYAGEGTLAAPDIVHFNHGLGEIFNALWAAGLTISAFEEHRELPWNPLGDAMVASDIHDGEFMLASGQERLPLSYTLQAMKPPTHDEPIN